MQALADTLGAPLTTTLPAKGLFSGHKYDLGVFGSLSTPQATAAIIDSDCVIAMGASLNRLTGGGDGWPFLRGKRVVQCDHDLAAIGAHYAVDSGVLADTASFAESVVEWLNEANYESSNFRDAVVAEDGATSSAPTQPPRTGTVDLAVALSEINRVLPWERSVSVDGGRCVPRAVQIMEVPRPQSWAFAGRGLGAVGNGLATAIGLGCANPGNPAVAVVGDGAFMLGGLAEFNTAVRYQVDLVVVVCNDGSYGAEYRKLKERDFDVAPSLFAWPDFALVAESLGGQGYTVRSGTDLARVGQIIEGRDRPLLIDLKLDVSKIAAT